MGACKQAKHYILLADLLLGTKDDAPLSSSNYDRRGAEPGWKGKKWNMLFLSTTFKSMAGIYFAIMS